MSVHEERVSRVTRTWFFLVENNWRNGTVWKGMAVKSQTVEEAKRKLVSEGYYWVAEDAEPALFLGEIECRVCSGDADWCIRGCLSTPKWVFFK